MSDDVLDGKSLVVVASPGPSRKTADESGDHATGTKCIGPSDRLSFQIQRGPVTCITVLFTDVAPRCDSSLTYTFVTQPLTTSRGPIVSAQRRHRAATQYSTLVFPHLFQMPPS
jgi:hypothetical protein